MAVQKAFHLSEADYISTFDFLTDADIATVSSVGVALLCTRPPHFFLLSYMITHARAFCRFAVPGQTLLPMKSFGAAALQFYPQLTPSWLQGLSLTTFLRNASIAQLLAQSCPGACPRWCTLQVSTPRKYQSNVRLALKCLQDLAWAAPCGWPTNPTPQRWQAHRSHLVYRRAPTGPMPLTLHFRSSHLPPCCFGCAHRACTRKQSW